MELIKGEAPTAWPGTIRTAASLKLSPGAPPGRYEVKLALEDLLGNRGGSGTGSFTLLGKPVAAVKNLTMTGLRAAGDARVPVGAVVPIAFDVKGFTTRTVKHDLHRIHLTIKATLEDEAGQAVTTRSETLLRRELTFEPTSYPLEHAVALPATLTPGPYRVALQVKDEVGGGQSNGLLRIRVTPKSFGIFNLHLHDAAGSPRNSFLLGEQVYVRLSVHGLQTDKTGQVEAAVDLAVAGPGGVYLATKRAASTSGAASRAFARAGRYPVELPLILPALCPTGKYRVVIRARDAVAGRDTVREHTFEIHGDAPKHLKTFRADGLTVRDRPDLPATEGDTFGAGRSYHLDLRLGGLKAKPVPRKRLTFWVKAKASLKLLRAGRVVHEAKDLFQLDRQLTYRPLRVLMHAKWQVPATLPGGLYDLAVVAEDQQDDHVSQLMRRVEIVSAGPAVRVPLP
jgi:hypothetical protein